MSAVTVADEKIASRFLEQEVAEVLASHRGLELLYVVRPYEATQQLARKLCGLWMVHGWRIVAFEYELTGRIESMTGCFSDTPHPLLD
jgi:hypothetical protein